MGPRVETLELFGNKVRARDIAAENKVPVLPGTESLNSADEARVFFESLGSGSTMILKAVGGGGRGTRAVEKVSEIASLYEEASIEAQNAFGNGDL